MFWLDTVTSLLGVSGLSGSPSRREAIKAADISEYSGENIENHCSWQRNEERDRKNVLPGGHSYNKRISHARIPFARGSCSRYENRPLLSQSKTNHLSTYSQFGAF